MGCNFFDAESIGVIARGPSSLRLDVCCGKFRHCFLAGEFDETLDLIGHYLEGKHIVLSIMQNRRYRTSEETCRRLGIRNLQIHLQENTRAFSKAKRRHPDLKVVGHTKQHYEMGRSIFAFGSKKIYSTGIAGVFHALYFKPKELHIIGLDFYDESLSQYAVNEKHDVVSDTSQVRNLRAFRTGMLANLRAMQRYSPETKFHLYTTFRGVTSYKNFLVHYVSLG